MPTKDHSQLDPKKAGQASKTHGTYAVRDRGKAAMTPEQRGLYVEILQQLETPDGTLEAMRDLAANSILLAKIAQSYCIEQHEQGVPLEKIALLKALPAFLNSASRQLKILLAKMPKDKTTVYSAELERMTEIMNEPE